MNKVTELELLDVNDPDYGAFDLWMGRTSTSDCGVELSVTGLLNMQCESLSCTVTKENALKLAKAIQDHFNEGNDHESK